MKHIFAAAFIAMTALSPAHAGGMAPASDQAEQPAPEGSMDGSSLVATLFLLLVVAAASN